MANRYDEQLFLDYVEGDLTPPEKARFEKMMAEDKKLSGLVAQMIDDRRRLRRLPRDNPPADLMDQVTSRLERNMLLDAPAPELNPVTQPRGFRNSRVLAYAGLAAMVLISTAVVMHTLTEGKLYDQLAITDGDNQTLAKKDSDTELAVPLSSPKLSAGLRTESLALKEEVDSFEEARQTAPQPSTEPQPSQLALGKSKANRERQFENLTPQSKVGRSLTIAQEKNTPAFELRLPSSDGTKQNRALDKIESNKVETFALLTPPETPVAPAASAINEPQQAPGDLAQKIMQHLALLDEKLPATGPAEEEKTELSQVELVPNVSIQSGVLQSSLEGTINPPPQPMQIKALVPDITEAQQTLLGWAVLNQIPIIRLASSDAKQPKDPYRTDRDVNGFASDPSRSNRIVLTMSAGDIPRLLEHFNEKSGQSARLVAQPQFWNGAKRQTPPTQFADTPPRVDPLAATDSPRGFAFDHQSRQDTAESDAEKNYPQLPVINELDWGQLLLPRLPFRPVVPVYAPDTPIQVTVHIYKQSESEPAGDD